VTAPDLAAGQIVGGKHTVRGILRHNGLTATYRALTQVGRDVALKVFDPAALSKPEIVARLKESETATNVLPGNAVLHVLESGTDEPTGAPFVVSDFSPHPSLQDLLSLCPLTAPDAITVVRQLARTLDAARAVGTSHLGLKPSNIFVGPAPACATKIGDFGVVVVRSTLRAGRDPAPVDFPWMAPEQAGFGGAVGCGADVFSLGLVAFFALTGRSYWRSCQGEERDVVGWKREIQAERTSASVRARELNGALHAGADPVFARALALSDADRYPSAADFADALAAVLDGPAVAAAPARPAEPAAPKPAAARKMTMMGAGPCAGRAAPRPSGSTVDAANQPPAAVPRPGHAVKKTVENLGDQRAEASPPAAAVAVAAPAAAVPVAVAEAPVPQRRFSFPAPNPRNVARVALITAGALALFGAIAWGAISLVASWLSPAPKPAASQAAASASAPVAARAVEPPAASETASVAVAPAPPAESAAAPPAQEPQETAQKNEPAEPAHTAAPAKAPSKTTPSRPSKPSKSCGKFLKKCP
jgi:eukaryotic-like serine/threonine-protein kinase